MIENKESDLYIKSNSNIQIRLKGRITLVKNKFFTNEQVHGIAREILEKDFPNFEKTKNVDFIYLLDDGHRFRINMFYQIYGISTVARAIFQEIKTIDDLNLPSMIESICDNTSRGLVLVTGVTGSGKTTTIASMIDRIN